MRLVLGRAIAVALVAPARLRLADPRPRLVLAQGAGARTPGTRTAPGADLPRRHGPGARRRHRDGHGDEPVTDLQTADFEVTEDDVPQAVETITVHPRRRRRATSDLNEPLEIRSREHATLEAAREDVRLFAIFLDDYHIDKRPDITLPLREALTKFVNQLGAERPGRDDGAADDARTT